MGGKVKSFLDNQDLKQCQNNGNLGTNLNSTAWGESKEDANYSTLMNVEGEGDVHEPGFSSKLFTSLCKTLYKQKLSLLWNNKTRNKDV